MTVAACLLVKNEAPVIGRCLASLDGLVQAVVIVDTGSTDKTIDVLHTLRSPVPIHLHQRQWQGFVPNRTELLRLAAPMADYLLLLDADQTVAGRLPKLTADAYSVRLRSGSLEWRPTLVVRSALPWRYEGATHEYVACEQAAPPVALDSLSVTDHADGGGRPAGTHPRWEANVDILEQELAREPGNPRNVFLLALAYDDLARARPDDPRAGDWRQKAAVRYRERVQLGDDEDETPYALCRLGVLRLTEGDGLLLLLQAWQRCPQRWEALHEACRWLNQRGLYQASYALSKLALAHAVRPSGQYLAPDVYDHLLLFEHSMSAYYADQYEESLAACNALLTTRLPADVEAAVRRNLVFPRQKLEGRR